VAFAVDINGVALARCNLAATEEGAAEEEARQHLEDHQVCWRAGLQGALTAVVSVVAI